jgi:hypothetical protein
LVLFAAAEMALGVGAAVAARATAVPDRRLGPATLAHTPALTVDAGALSGLVSSWPGEGDAGDSAGGNDGSLENGAAFAPGVVGQAFSFDGVDDFVSVPDAASLDPTGAISIDAWVFESGASDGADLVGKDGEGSDRQYLLSIGTVTQRFRAHVGVPSGFQFIDGATVVQLNTWYHVAMTYDGATLKLYVNGEPDASLAVSGDLIQTTQPLRIGGGAPPGLPPLHLKGLIDEAELFDRALTADEVRAIYEARSASLPDRTETALASSPATPVWGQPMTVTASVTDATAAATVPTGTISFELDGSSIGDPVTLNSAGQASFTTSSLAVGSHTVTASYADGATFSQSSDSLSQAVGKADTTSVETLSPDPTVAGQDATFTTTVIAKLPGAGKPTGSVQFAEDDGTSIGPPKPLDTAGKASLTASADAGSYRVHVRYLGDAHFNVSTASVPQQVNRAGTTTQLTSSPNPVAPSANVMFIALVGVSPPGNVEPFGSLQFTVDGSPLGDPIPLDGAAGVQVTVTAPTVAQTNTIGVSYSGDENTTPSSASLQQTVGTPSSSTTTPAPAAATAASKITAMVAVLTRALRRRGLAALTRTTQRLTAGGPGVLGQKVYTPNAPRSAVQSKAKTALIASGRHRFAAAGTETLRLKLTAAGRRALRRAKSLKISIVTRFTPTGGRPVIAVKRVTVKPKRKRSASARTAAPLRWRMRRHSRIVSSSPGSSATRGVVPWGR